MANSRSNIYPVQLQGAELNLNKFDAEIKQYSGFNKNNSPFVGGCLSNLFTKTEENTTGSSDSVYVDDNGDVYEAKTDGLYKNGEKVIEPEGAEFEAYRVEEFFNMPDNVIHYDYDKTLNKEVYFYIKEAVPYDELYIKKIDLTSGVVTENKITDLNYPDITNQYYKVFADYDFSCDAYIVKVVFSAPYLAYIGPVMVIFNNGTVSLSQLFNSLTGYKFVHTDAPCTIMKSGDYLLGFSNMPSNNVFKSLIGSEIITYSNISTQSSLQHDDSIPNSNIRNFTIIKSWFNNNLNYYAFCAPYFGETVYPQNKDMVLCCKISYDSGANKIVFDDSVRELILPNVGTNSIVSFCVNTINDGFFIRKFGCNYALSNFNTDRTQKYAIGVCGEFVTQNVTYVLKQSGDFADEDKNVMLYMGSASHFCVANNGFVTGITLPGAKILASEWNSVDKDYIFLSASGSDFYSIVWKDVNNNKWYRLLPTNRIMIKNLDGQLVLNINQVKNSYRLSDGKILMFANAWNNRAASGNIVTDGSVSTENTSYMASSINEYNLKDNASILLNPIQVINNSVVLGRTYKSVINYNKLFSPNYYRGDGADDVLYYGSFIPNSDGGFDFARKRNLIGLPFPINTSGNVQLSPSLFCKTERFGNDVFIKEGSNAYQLIKDGAESVMSYYLGTLIENLEDIFILQGQYYAIIDKQIFNVQFSGGVVQSLSFVVSVENLQFCGNSAYQAYFFSKTNRCIYVFTGANILNQLQLVDKISEIYAYKYNQSTQSIILITDIGTIVSSNLGMYLIEGFTPDDVFFYDKGVVFVSDSELTYLQYYEADGFEKHNIEVETCFYGMNNETVTINDCLYFRLFSEEHEEGEVKVSATTISLKGRKTETTVFKFKASDWDALTHSVYVRYQPKEQRGLGISFSINSPFKIASLSVGSKADAILVDKVSKGAVITPSNNDEW